MFDKIIAQALEMRETRHQATIESLKEYLRDLRLKKAVLLLQDPTLSIKEIAAAVGYKYVSDFDHHFKSTYGMRPGEYRRSQRI